MPKVAERRAAVLGAGTMAPGIALAFAEAGYRVLLWARSSERGATALDRLRDQATFLESHGLGGSARQVVSLVDAVTDIHECAEADIVIEAISEVLEAKRSLFAVLDRACARTTVLATTTSGLRVTDIAVGLEHPERVLAMHFWNPAHLMPIVEVAAGGGTSEETLVRGAGIAADIGKIVVRLSREVLGFLGTRMQQAVVREAIALLEAGVASAHDIDLAVRTSFGIRFPAIGPLEAADLSGLDVIAAIHGYLLPDLDRSSAPQAALRELVDRGDLGAKTGRGFHDWPRPQVEAVTRRRDEELVRRLRLMIEQGVLPTPTFAGTGP